MVRTATFACSFLLLSASMAEARRHGRAEGNGLSSKLSAETVNSAKLNKPTVVRRLGSSLTLRLQVMLDRAHFSPGEISGRPDENTIKAFEIFKKETGSPENRRVTAADWDKLVELGTSSGGAEETRPLTVVADTAKKRSRRRGSDDSSGEREQRSSNQDQDTAIVQVTVGSEDAGETFLKEIPAKLEDKAGLEKLSYTSVEEELGERYHVSPKLLRALNPDVRFDQEGQQIWVPNVHSVKPHGLADKVVADKDREEVYVYGKDSKLIAAYPATVGSDEKPSPAGNTEVERVARDPWYSYDPTRVHFKGVNTDQVIKIAPGPNNPVGLVWIALATGEGYGIHGTPEPSTISKTSSHGCIRLTNWDALELASLVEKGTPVALPGGADERLPGGKDAEKGKTASANGDR